MGETVVGEFASTLRAQITAARAELEAARAGRDFEGIRSCGLRLRYLLDIAEEHRIDPDQAGETDAPGPGRGLGAGEG